MISRVAVLLALLAATIYYTNAYGEPLYAAEAQGVRIVLYNEPCKLPEVTNLPYRAVWTENGKDVEGCVGARPDLGIVMGYFADKTVAAFPVQVFEKVKSI